MPKVSPSPTIPANTSPALSLRAQPLSTGQHWLGDPGEEDPASSWKGVRVTNLHPRVSRTGSGQGGGGQPDPELAGKKLSLELSPVPPHHLIHW